MKVHNPQAGDETIRAIDERNAFTMHTLLNGVIRGGTGARAYRELKRVDMGGKTGTPAPWWPWAGWGTTRCVRSETAKQGAA